MTIVHTPLRGPDVYRARGGHRFGDRDQLVRYPEAWEHETLAEEQALRERSRLEYARVCEEVRQAQETGGRPRGT
jgi:hypothetical protein